MCGFLTAGPTGKSLLLFIFFLILAHDRLSLSGRTTAAVFIVTNYLMPLVLNLKQIFEVEYTHNTVNGRGGLVSQS